MAVTYKNLDSNTTAGDLKGLIRWQLGLYPQRPKPTPATGVPIPTTDVDPKLLGSAGVESLTWIGHSSFLLRLRGQNILFDPMMSDHIAWFVRRNVKAGIAWHYLPNPDVVCITHNHRDHLDEATIKKLGPAPLYLVPQGLGLWFKSLGMLRVQEFAWWQSEQYRGLKFTFVPAQHWSRRGILDINTSWWGGFIVEYDGHKIYHAGDSAMFSGFQQIGEQIPDIDIAMLPIGAYDPRWFMKAQHMDPDEAIEAFLKVRAKRFVAMHWGTFKLTDEPLQEPPMRLKAAWEKRDMLSSDQLHIPAVGESIIL